MRTFVALICHYGREQSITVIMLSLRYFWYFCISLDDECIAKHWFYLTPRYHSRGRGTCRKCKDIQGQNTFFINPNSVIFVQKKSWAIVYKHIDIVKEREHNIRDVFICHILILSCQLVFTSFATIKSVRLEGQEEPE